MKISIVMPTYNGLKYIKEAIGSVLQQDFADWELLISDDGSKDGTREYLLSLQDPRIKVHLQEKNLGIFGNLNFLFERAQADLTQILCQDDHFIGPTSLKRILDEWAGQAPDVSYMRFNHGFDSASKLVQYETHVLPAIVTPEQSDLYFFIFGCIPGNLSNVSLCGRLRVLESCRPPHQMGHQQEPGREGAATPGAGLGHAQQAG
jgi:glycosyltransferase involved in cell wall biosynthesis